MIYWSEYKLGDICKIVGGGTPSKKEKMYYENGNIPWITPKDLSGYKFRTIKKGATNITKLGLEKSSTKLMPKGTVLFSSRAPIGYVAIAQNSVCTNQGFKSFICDEKMIHNRYLYYWLKQNIESIERMASGTTFKEISANVARNIRIKLPPIKDQHTIADLLWTLDDKIELNIMMNQTLEEMAVCLYKHWFVDFGPIQDGEFVETELGMIPNGWQVGSLKDIANILMGQSPKSEFYNQNGEGLPFHQGVKDFGDRFPSHVTYCTKELRVANAGDILVSVRAPVGRLNVTDKKIIIGRGLAALSPKSDYYSFFLYTLKHLFAVEDQYGSGTVFNSITKKDLESLQVIIPDEKSMKEFEEKVSKYDALIAKQSKEIDLLIQTRDYLLPRLLSGEIEVTKAEKQIKEVL